MNAIVGGGTRASVSAAASARNSSANGSPYRKRTCAAPTVPSTAVRLLCIALRAVCARAAISVATIQSNRVLPSGARSGGTWPDVHALRSDQPSRRTLLETVCRPPGRPSDRENGREERRLDPEAVQQQRGVELDVGSKPPAGLVHLEQPQRRRFDRARERVELMVSGMREHALRRRAEHVGAWIAHLVDPVAEAHQALASRELRREHGFRPLGITDLEHGVERGTGRTAVERTLERTDR